MGICWYIIKDTHVIVEGGNSYALWFYRLRQHGRCGCPRSVPRRWAGKCCAGQPHPAKAEALAEALGCRAATNDVVAQDCDVIFLGVKPQMMADMLAGIAPILAKRSGRFILVTMAAGLSMARVREMAGGAYPIIRIMPNTPVSLGAGMIQYCADGVSDDQMFAFLGAMARPGGWMPSRKI